MNQQTLQAPDTTITVSLDVELPGFVNAAAAEAILERELSLLASQLIRRAYQERGRAPVRQR